MPEPERLYLLHYDYVENIVERRAPFRAEHLAHAGRWREDGRLILGGAVGDPPTGGLLVFRVSDPSEVEAFADADPFVHAGLITGRRVEPWTVTIR